MGDVIDLFPVEPQPEFPLSDSWMQTFLRVFEERNYEPERWRKTALVVPSLDVAAVIQALRNRYGFAQLAKDSFDPGRYDRGNREAILAVKARATEIGDPRSEWNFTCGYWVLGGGDWYFKQDPYGNFHSVIRHERVFLKSSPLLPPPPNLRQLR